MLMGMDVDELQHALGGVVLEAAYMERVLRTAFSALVGSKYAAVVDERLTAAALIEDYERITKYHTGITESAKEAVWAALRACHEANRQRNRVIHDSWAARARQRDGYASRSRRSLGRGKWRRTPGLLEQHRKVSEATALGPLRGSAGARRSQANPSRIVSRDPVQPVLDPSALSLRASAALDDPSSNMIPP